MILKNGIKTQIGERKLRYQGFLNPVLMDGKPIKPYLEVIGGVAYVRNAPYDATIDLATGARNFYPDKKDHSKRLILPSVALLSALTKNIVATPTQIDKQTLPNMICMPTPWGEIRIIFKNNKVALSILVTKRLPFKSLAFPIDSVGYDLIKMLTDSSGLVIPHPAVIDADFNQIDLKWTYKDGQISLDLPDVKTPFEFKNATIVVNASADDCTHTAAAVNITSTSVRGGDAAGTNYDSGMIFRGANIAAGSTIDTCTLYLAEVDSSANTCNTVIKCQKSAAPNVFSDGTDWDARTWNATPVAWAAITAFVTGQFRNSPDFSSALQEVVDELGAMTDVGVGWFDNSSSFGASRIAYAEDHATGAPPQLNVTWTEAGGAAFVPRIMGVI